MTVSRSLLPMLLGVCACLGSANPAGAVVRYVDSRAAPGGNGLSWPTAYDSLSAALTAAQPGDQIWVVAGRYVGNFTLALGVEVYGGFAGTETELTQRDWKANQTILDGNKTGSVVRSPSWATATTRIDGFTITNGSGTLRSTNAHGGDATECVPVLSRSAFPECANALRATVAPRQRHPFRCDS